MIKLKKSLITIFKEQQNLEDTKLEIRKKSFIPTRSAINKIEGKIGDVLDQNTNLMNLVPVVQSFADISIPESEEYFYQQVLHMNQ